MYKEIKESGAVKLPRKLMGTTAEKTAFVTTGLPVGSTWSETDATATGSNAITYSDDWGVDNFAHAVGTIGAATSIYKMLILENGNMVAWATTAGNTQIYLSTDSGANWTSVLDMVVSGTHELFGAKAWGKYVMACQYSNTLDIAHKAFLSQDYGATFTECFDIYNQFTHAVGQKYHTHDCAIDPFELNANGQPLLWVSCGDSSSNTYWSDDLGVTWQMVCSPDKSVTPLQNTQIIPLRDCVLFLSDNRLTAVQRYNRPTSGTSSKKGQDLPIEAAKIIFIGWGVAGATEVPIGATASIDFRNSKAVFGWGLTGNCAAGNLLNSELLRGQVYATDGYQFTEIFNHGSTLVGQGVCHVMGPDSNGDIVARIDGTTSKKFNKSMWD